MIDVQFNTHGIERIKVAKEGPLREVDLQNLPQLLVIAGVNGSGKTTLFAKLKAKHTPQHEVGLISAFRGVRRRYGKKVDYFSQDYSFTGHTYQKGKPPAFQHEQANRIQHYSDPFGLDTSMEAIDPTLCSMKSKLREAIADKAEDAGTSEVPGFRMPDVFKPLHEALRTFLPSLEFLGVETTASDTFTQWKSNTGLSGPLRFHDLSSGEKNVLTILFPIIEPQMLQILDAFTGRERATGVASRTLLIDEPENHLHESLQRQLLEFLRRATLQPGVQVLLATHSGSILDVARSNELYIMRAASATPSGQSQLVRAADDDETLTEIRSAFGCTSRIAMAGPVLVVEGRQTVVTRSGLSDQMVYRELFGDLVHRDLIIARGGRSSCLEAVKGIGSFVRRARIGKPVVCLLDGDLSCGVEAEIDGAIVLNSPMSTIENWFLAPPVLAHIASVHGNGMSEAAVIAFRDELLASRRDHEVVRRMKGQFGLKTIRMTGDSREQAHGSVKAQLVRLLAEHSADDLDTLVAPIELVVDEELKTGNAWRSFDGKAILPLVFQHLAPGVGTADLMDGGLHAIREVEHYVAVRERIKEIACRSGV